MRVIDYYNKHRMELSRRYISLPLIGNGAGIAICSNAIVKLNSNQDFVALILPSTWLFFLGVVVSALSVVFATKGIQEIQNSLISDLNSKSLLVEMKRKLKLDEVDNPKAVFDSLLEYEAGLIQRIIDDWKLYKDNDLKGKKSMKFSRWLSWSSMMLFPLAILTVLVPISSNFTFCWLKLSI